ncbi:MAG: hypothetical protein KGK01_10780 [Bradyrhizobium sp.]|nr:hypothetical protein [Bradyrhizobium sp.]MDE2472233.1 hypothetical protein [Bradyrhizobium sp.]
MMPEQCEQYYDGERHSQKPKQRTSSKAHDCFLLQWCPDNVASIDSVPGIDGLFSRLTLAARLHPGDGISNLSSDMQRMKTPPR